MIENFQRQLSNKKEEQIQRFLTQHSEVLLRAFCPTGTYLCIPKFRFGIEFISDFILVQVWSTITKIILVELEPPTVRPFTRSGRYAMRLNGALQQINDWLSWIRENQTYFCDSIVRHAEEVNPKAANSLRYRINYNTVSAKIIIGRRHMYSEADNARRSAFYLASNGAIEILPYDRLLDVAESISEVS